MDSVSALVITSAFDNVLRKARQFTGTWAEFVELLGDHVAGPKNGRAVVPYMADWAEGEVHQPRAEAHLRPGARWTILTLDLDECSDEALEDAQAKLEREGVSYVMHSTFSFEPEGRMKARVHVPVSEPLVEAQVAEARVRLATWLGVATDKATRGGHTLFYTPRCPLEHIGSSFLLSARRRPVTLQELPPAPPSTVTIRAPETARSAVKPLLEWPEPVRKEALGFLRFLCDHIRAHRTTHLRTDIMQSLVPVAGGFAGSGVLDREEALTLLETAVDERAAEFLFDDHTADERVEELNKLFEHGYAKPILPHGFDPETGEGEAKRFGKDRTEAVLRANKPDIMYTVPQAAAEMHAFLRKPRHMAAPWVGLIEVSVGVGKTWALRQLASERAARGEYTVILSLDHALLGQIRRDLDEAGTRARQLHSVMQPTEKTGGPECRRRFDVDIKMLVRQGASIQGSACNKCPHKTDCAALKMKSRALDCHVVLAPYDMAEHALGMIAKRKDAAGAPLLVCDEEPPGPSTVIVSDEELDEVRDSGAWSLLRSDQVTAVAGLVHALEHKTEPPVELLEEVQSYYGQLHMTGYSLDEQRRYGSDLDIIRKCMLLAGGWSNRRHVKDAWRTEVPQKAWRALREEGGYVLSATPNKRLYEQLGVEVQTLSLRVHDHQMAPGVPSAQRIMLYSSHGSRSRVAPAGDVNWDIVKVDLTQVFRAIPRRGEVLTKVLIGTFKAVSDGLKTEQHMLANRPGFQVALTHYEVVRGRDDWKDFDAFVSLYDPRIPPPMKTVCNSDGKESLVKDWDASYEAASRTLEQFHGRARDPQPRERPALHYHLGSIPPMNWWKEGEDGNTEMHERSPGTPPEPLSDEVCDALKRLFAELGSAAAAARHLSYIADVPVPPKTFRRWMKEQTGLKGEKLHKIRVALGLDAR